MASNQNMSVEEIVAACRQTDGEGGSGTPSESAAPTESKPATEDKPAAPKKKPGAMSVEEMMAAARGEKSGGGKGSAPADKPAKATPKKKPGAMSVEEMMAAARGEKSADSKDAEKKAPAKKAGDMSVEEMMAAARKSPGAKKSPAKGKAKPKDTPAETGGPKDTQSILSAARKAAKPGPMSKAEAAAQGKEAPKSKGKARVTAPPMPEKPAYAKPRSKEKSAEPRRSFMGVFFGSFLAVGFTSLGLTNLLWSLGVARFMFPNILIEPPTKFKVGSPDDFPPGGVATKFKAQFGVWIVRDTFNGVPMIYALQTICTHLGCTPNWLDAEQKFKCPCHGSGFYKDGVNFEGPAPRPLERYAIRLAEDGQLEVDKSRSFQQEMGQWNDPACYVPV